MSKLQYHKLSPIHVIQKWMLATKVKISCTNCGNWIVLALALGRLLGRVWNESYGSDDIMDSFCLIVLCVCLLIKADSWLPRNCMMFMFAGPAGWEVVWKTSYVAGCGVTSHAAVNSCELHRAEFTSLGYICTCKSFDALLFKLLYLWS